MEGRGGDHTMCPRVAASFLAVGFGANNPRERLFVSLAWLPKATVQVLSSQKIGLWKKIKKILHS